MVLNMDSQSKICGLCGLNLLLVHFRSDSRTSDGFSTYCTDCAESIDPTSVEPNQPHMTDRVYCQGCKDFHPRERFSPDRRRITGVSSWCRQFTAKYQKDRRTRIAEQRPTIDSEIRDFIKTEFGTDQTPLSALRGPRGNEVPEKLFAWFPQRNQRTLRQHLFNMCVREARDAAVDANGA